MTQGEARARLKLEITTKAADLVPRLIAGYRALGDPVALLTCSLLIEYDNGYRQGVRDARKPLDVAPPMPPESAVTLSGLFRLAAEAESSLCARAVRQRPLDSQQLNVLLDRARALRELLRELLENEGT